MESGISLIDKERTEQIVKHGRTLLRDVNENKNFQLKDGAIMLLHSGIARSDERPAGWDFDIWVKMKAKPYKERLIIAGALLAAEIDRINHEL